MAFQNIAPAQPATPKEGAKPAKAPAGAGAKGKKKPLRGNIGRMLREKL